MTEALWELEGSPPEQPPVWTERDMLNLLSTRYEQHRPGALADRYVRAEHVRSTQSYMKLLSVADFIAVDKWSSKQAIHGHEVKVSRSDWLTELRDPTKADRVKRFCNFWWLVVPDASIVAPGELPDDWGLMVVRKSAGQLRIKKRAPQLEPDTLTLDFIAGLTAAVQRTAMREPLHRDAPNLHIGTWYDKCGWCGGPGPCGLHQPRKHREKEAI